AAEGSLNIRRDELSTSFTAAEIQPDGSVFALHAELKHEEGAALALQLNPRGNVAEGHFAGVDLERVAVRHGALRRNGAHHLLDPLAPFRALLRLEGLEVAGEGRNGVGGSAGADQGKTGEE